MSTQKSNKHTVDYAILKLSAESGNLPEVSEIEAFTGLKAITIIRNLDKDYPKELLITNIERIVLNAYKENHSLRAISEATGIAYYDVSNTITRLKNKGIIKRFVNKSDGPTCRRTTYIEITGEFIYKMDIGSKVEKINLKGARGYIDDTSYMAVVYLNNVGYKFYGKNCEYREIGRQE